MRLIKTSLIILLIMLLPHIAWAAMSSTNYYIYSDSLDYGGGLSTSTSNILQDSIGSEIAVGISTSTSYQVKAGYQGVENGTITLTLSSNNIDFGQPNASVIVTSSLLVTIDTTSDSGYTLSISSVIGSALVAVSDGAVNGSGSAEEYGLALSGSHAAFSDDRAIVSGLVLSSFSSFITNDQTTLIFKAVRSSVSGVQNYSQDITLTVAAN